MGITAGTITAAGDADSQMTLTLTQDATGRDGNTAIDVSGVTHLTSTRFSGGDGNWASVGGDYHTSTYVAGSTMPLYTYTFENGHEDIELDVTATVEEWIAGTHANYGFGIFLTSSQEAYTTASDSDGVLSNAAGAEESYYTKRFFSR